MAEYIEREAAKKALADKLFQNYGYAILTIMEVPAADVEPVKHAKWITINSVSRCSSCEYIPPYDKSIDDIFYSAYCPNCGAKMENSEVKNNDRR